MRQEWGNLLLTLEGHKTEVNFVSFSEPSTVPDDKMLLASASKDTTVRIWDVSSGSLLWTLEGHTDDVVAVVFLTAASSTDKKVVASASYDRTVRLWDVDSGLPVTMFPYSVSNVNPVFTTTPDQKTLFAFVADNYIVELWDVASCSLWKRFGGDEIDTYTAITFSAVAHGKHILAAATSIGIIRLWDVSSGSQLPSVHLSSHWDIFRMALSASVTAEGKHFLAFEAQRGLLATFQLVVNIFLLHLLLTTIPFAFGISARPRVSHIYSSTSRPHCPAVPKLKPNPLQESFMHFITDNF